MFITLVLALPFMAQVLQGYMMRRRSFRNVKSKSGTRIAASTLIVMGFSGSMSLELMNQALTSWFLATSPRSSA